jgi:hypothetical protein
MVIGAIKTRTEMAAAVKSAGETSAGGHPSAVESSAMRSEASVTANAAAVTASAPLSPGGYSDQSRAQSRNYQPAPHTYSITPDARGGR